MNSIDDLDLSKSYTYADYLLWTFEDRLELIKGKIFKMTPAPNLRHQVVSGNLYRLISNFLWKNPCKVFSAPFDVRLVRSEKSDKKVKTVVQPDLCVVCDLTKLADGRSCLGAPDIVVEILSPGNNAKELQIKYDLYEEFGVKEYWLIHPTELTFLRYSLNEAGKFVGDRMLTIGDKVITPILKGLEMDLSDVFEE